MTAVGRFDEWLSWGGYQRLPVVPLPGWSTDLRWVFSGFNEKESARASVARTTVQGASRAGVS